MRIKNVGVVGAGTMGNGIAQAFAVAGFPVVLNDLAPEALAFLAPLLDGRARRAGSLEATGGDDRAGTWIDDASRSGLFEVVDPTDWGVVVDEEHR